ncbi:MAG TPA: UDP-N-acetylmuramoyl-L-alanyl-D-glutamate--2,6-diaminopimelate ligase [Candidatus Eisenbacteria bacterium]|nr:UDP-N-acetylmuramoyl-L-alanyl-D-glutamate--2,6-diaminopimelate ligase [Candidatus Eisenbacteria bacterium]
MIGTSVRDAAALPRLLGAREARGVLAGSWSRVQYDSRAVGTGDLFVAVPGAKADGHAFLAAARAKGALAAVVERFVPDEPLPQIAVESARRALALLAGEETDHPSRELTLVGVTGTNGKTTTTHLVRAALERHGERTGVIGTVGYEFEGVRTDAAHTTPEAPELSRLLRLWRDAGADAVVMEVSSHALALDRTYGLAFDAGVFTNLTQDHLDFHGTLEAYRDAKARFFRAGDRGDRSKPFVGVLNLDDPAGAWLREHGDGRFLTFGRSAAAEVSAEDVRLGPTGTRLRIRHPRGTEPVALRLRGAFNVMNALGAFGACYVLGVPPAEIAEGLGALERVPGRLEPVEAGQPFQVFVDYAHTPDALERALEAVRALEPARLRCVFGCGGDRDRGKRPLMGAAAARLADDVIVTSDNPRSEDPAAIVAEILAGVPGEGAAARVRSIVDRAEAIGAAVDACEPGDALLIAGKGHETYQILGDRTIEFDDRAVALKALRARGYAA